MKDKIIKQNSQKLVINSSVSQIHATSIFRMKWRWSQHGPLKRRYPTPTLHGVTSQKTNSNWYFASFCFIMFPRILFTALQA